MISAPLLSSTLLSSQMGSRSILLLLSSLSLSIVDYTSSVNRLLRLSPTVELGVSLLAYPPPPPTGAYPPPPKPSALGLPTPELCCAGLSGIAGVLGTVLLGLIVYGPPRCTVGVRCGPGESVISSGVGPRPALGFSSDSEGEGEWPVKLAMLLLAALGLYAVTLGPSPP